MFRDLRWVTRRPRLKMFSKLTPVSISVAAHRCIDELRISNLMRKYNLSEREALKKDRINRKRIKE